MRRIARIATVLIGLAAFGVAMPAVAQEDLDAGKTPPQLFKSDCSVCHSSPRGLAKGGGFPSLSSFLRQHYTSSQRTASVLTKYLLSGAGAGERQAPVTTDSRSRPTVASRSPPLPPVRVGPDGKPRAKPKPSAAKPAKDAAKPDKKSPKKKDEQKKIEQAAKPAEPPAQGDRSDGDENPEMAAPAARKQLTAIEPTQPRPVTASPSGTSIGESTGGPLRNAVPAGGAAPEPEPPAPPPPRFANSSVPLAGRVPATRPPPRRTDTIAD